jgi:hypothetical protein
LEDAKNDGGFIGALEEADLSKEEKKYQ